MLNLLEVVYQMSFEKLNDWYWLVCDMKCNPIQQWGVVYEVQFFTELISLKI
jgi:hypothetical protein